MLHLSVRKSAAAAARTLRGCSGNSFHVSAPRRVVFEEDKPWYVLGISIADHFGDLKVKMSEQERQAMAAGFRDRFCDLMLDKSSLLAADKYGAKAMETLQERNVSFGAVNERDAQIRKANLDYLAAMAAEEGAVQTPTTLVYKQVVEGKGPFPAGDSQVSVHYTGTLADGTVFHSTRKNKEPEVFLINTAIPGWREALRMMKVGGRAKLTMPPNLAYGASGAPSLKIPPHSTLTYDIELVGIIKSG